VADDLIVVGGEALYDLVLRADGSVDAHPGGGPFNTARTIGRLKQPVAYLGRLSSDRFGETHARMLADDGVDLGAVARTDEPTTLALAELDEAGSARYRFYAADTAAPGLTPEEALVLLPGTVAMLHVGTLGLVLEPLASALEAAVGRLSRTALVAVDPNVRPWAIPDEGDYRARLERVLRQSHLVKVSEEDLGWLAPRRRPLDAARELLDLGPLVALVTRGGEPALVVSRDRDTEVPVPRIQVADTIGAGDAFGGAFLAWWRSHRLGRNALTDHARVTEATRFAALVAAVTCTRAGASPPRLGELRAV
jgi:fructokinase